MRRTGTHPDLPEGVISMMSILYSKRSWNNFGSVWGLLECMAEYAEVSWMECDGIGADHLVPVGNDRFIHVGYTVEFL